MGTTNIMRFLLLDSPLHLAKLCGSYLDSVMEVTTMSCCLRYE